MQQRRRIDDTIRVTLRLPKEVYSALREYADKENVSLNSTMVERLESSLTESGLTLKESPQSTEALERLVQAMVQRALEEERAKGGKKK